jgi:Na+/proline symporter
VATFVPLLYGLYSERATEAGSLAASVLSLLAGLLFFPQARAVLAGVPGASALPAASTFRAFVLAVVVSGLVTVLAARVTSAQFDLDALRTEVRRLDDSPATTDGGRRTPTDGQPEVDD